eukprot:scaffold1928_cov381-Prasinococcus_capsulatus_cf.AAC.7
MALALLRAVVDTAQPPVSLTMAQPRSHGCCAPSHARSALTSVAGRCLGCPTTSSPSRVTSTSCFDRTSWSHAAERPAGGPPGTYQIEAVDPFLPERDQPCAFARGPPPPTPGSASGRPRSPRTVPKDIRCNGRAQLPRLPRHNACLVRTHLQLPQCGAGDGARGCVLARATRLRRTCEETDGLVDRGGVVKEGAHEQTREDDARQAPTQGEGDAARPPPAEGDTGCGGPNAIQDSAPGRRVSATASRAVPRAWAPSCGRGMGRQTTRANACHQPEAAQAAARAASRASGTGRARRTGACPRAAQEGPHPPRPRPAPPAVSWAGARTTAAAAAGTVGGSWRPRPHVRRPPAPTCTLNDHADAHAWAPRPMRARGSAPLALRAHDGTAARAAVNAPGVVSRGRERALAYVVGS